MTKTKRNAHYIKHLKVDRSQGKPLAGNMERQANPEGHG